jgi:hypothetical protein
VNSRERVHSLERGQAGTREDPSGRGVEDGRRGRPRDSRVSDLSLRNEVGMGPGIAYLRAQRAGERTRPPELIMIRISDL